MTITVRLATSQDLYAVVSLLRARELPTDGVADLLRATPQHALLAELNGQVVGCGALDVHGSSALLRSVAVARDLATLGVGSRLVMDLIALARTKSLASLYLLTSTADQWFPRFGFTVVERTMVPADIGSTIEFTKACPSSAIVMRCALSS